MKYLKTLFLASVVAGITTSVSAQLLLPTDAAAWDKGSGASDGSGNGGLVSQTISTSSFNLTTPDINDPSTWTSTENNWPSEFQGQDVDSLTGNPWIVYDLGADYTTLDTMYIITTTEASRGFKDVEIYYSSDLSGNAVTTWASGSNLTDGAANVVDYNFTTGWTQYGGTETIGNNGLSFGTQEIEPGLALDMSGIASARYIGIRALNSYQESGPNPFGTSTGDNARAGIGQIAFTVVPEPSTLSLIGLAGMALFIRRRR